MTQLMEANKPKSRLKRTSDWVFLDATFAWAMSPRPIAARVWRGGRRGEVRRDPQRRDGGFEVPSGFGVNQDCAVLTLCE